MINSIQRFAEIFKGYIEEFKYTSQRVKGVNGDVFIDGEKRTFEPLLDCVRLDKPMFIYSSNTSDYTGEVLDKGDRYEIHFPRFGKLSKEYTNDLAWVLDEDTVFFFERPYRDKVKRVLRKLLPENSVVQYGNDIIINEVKVGPTFMTGYIHNIDGPPHDMNGGIIYCLRWRNLEKLNEIFSGNNNHEERLHNPFKQKFSTLDQFLTCTKEEFEEMLEKGE